MDTVAGVLCLLLFVTFEEATNTLDCKMSQLGQEYNGTVNITKTGLDCQRWDSQTPHSHTYNTPGYFPDQTLDDASNYCRNPSRYEDGLWCYTMSSTRWECCLVPSCKTASTDRSRLDPDGKTDFKEGDTLGYRSTGNPIPTFNWTLNSTGKVFANTSRIKMTSAMSGQVLRSKAYNSVGRQAVTLNVTSVTAAPMNPDKDFAPACTGHPVLLAVVCLVIPMLSRP